MISLVYRLADFARRLRRSRDTVEQRHGRRGEDLAHRFLRRQGLTIVARNFRPLSGRGEIDLIARDGDALVFVEVKARATVDYGTPDRAVGLQKEQDVRRAAGEYVRRSGTSWDQVRFDVVSILLSDPPALEWIKDAFAVRGKL